MRATKG